MKTQIRSYLIAGLLVWLPIWITFLAIKFLMEVMDKSLLLLPTAYQPDNLLGFHIPGIGLIFTLLILFLTGMVMTNFLGKKLVALWDRMVNRIPLIRSIYMGVKKTLEVMVDKKTKAFRKVLLVEFPRAGAWSIAFQTGTVFSDISNKLKQDLITVFVPTTPNPTSGFIMIIPKEHTYELSMSIDEALKMIISLGVVQPQSGTISSVSS